MSATAKVCLILSIFTVTLGYSLYEKKYFENMDREATLNPILSKLPELELKEFYSKKELTSKSLLENSKGLLVHFWGTWCGPCEAELPEFLELSEKLKESNVKVLLLAVKDDNKAMKKFLKRFGRLPENVVVAHDKEGRYLNEFGTVKVPETYVFNSDGINKLKFVGPQDWKMPSFRLRISSLLSK